MFFDICVHVYLLIVRFNRRYIDYVYVLHHITGNFEVVKSITLPRFDSVLNVHVHTMPLVKLESNLGCLSSQNLRTLPHNTSDL